MIETRRLKNVVILVETIKGDILLHDLIHIYIYIYIYVYVWIFSYDSIECIPPGDRK